MINKEKKSKIKARLDIFLILGFFFFPLLSDFSPVFNILDEVVILIFIIIISIKSLYIKIDAKFLKRTIIIFTGYSVFLILKNSLPITHILQFVITIKFIIIYYYFSIKNIKYQILGIDIFIKTIILIYISSVFISIIQLTIPGIIDLSKDGRGLNGITLGGVFFSRTLYSQFLVFSLIIIKTIKPSRNKIINYVTKHRDFFILFTFILIFLTFTRKDLVFGLIVIYILYFKTLKGYKVFLLNVSFLLIIITIPIVSNTFFKKINDATFNEDQVRLIILNSGLKVFDYYKPFGSGPGTFGSVMSIKYDKVYKKFNIPERIYKGLKNQSRGPIFDVFIISLIAEYGLGSIFFLIFYFIINKSKENENQLFSTNISLVKFSILTFVILSSFTVPILNNIVGYLIFTMLGLNTNSHIYKRYLKN